MKLPLGTLLLVGSLALLATASAQSERRGESYAPRVIIYENANYKGDELTLFPGEEIDDLSRLRFRNGARVNDAISSVRVVGGVELLAFEHHRFEGQVIRVTGDVRNFADRRMHDTGQSWNDRISSLAVRWNRGGNGGDFRPGKPGVGPGNGNRPPARPVVSDPDPVIRRAYRELLRREVDPEGLRNYRGLMLDQGWSEQMVRTNIRRSDEFRGSGVDRLIQAAYREVLGRDPDPGGMAGYRRKILENDWSDEQLRADLKRSPEYREKNNQPGTPR